MLKRELYQNIWSELSLDKAMILLAGPRQSGKTTLSKMIAENFQNHLYFNWDIPSHRAQMVTNPTFFESVERKDKSNPLVVFDEIHKYKDWKNYLKGVFDEFHEEYKFLVSGSGRLDLYQRGGDSLAGRYYLFHLWPLTIAELGGVNRTIDAFLENPLEFEVNEDAGLEELWSRLSLFSGFPEPYQAGRKVSYRRWSNTYSRQLIREDIRDLTGVKSITDVETLFMLLPSRVGSPLSTTSLARDLKVSYNTVRSWIDILCRFYLAFTLGPWTRRIGRAIQKEQKLYLWDTPRIEDPGSRFENMVALELNRAVTCWTDLGHGQFSLHFLKTKDGREVDFLIAESNRPFLIIEAKLTDMSPSKPLMKFQDLLNVPAVQLVETGDHFVRNRNGDNTILVGPAYQWLARLP